MKLLKISLIALVLFCSYCGAQENRLAVSTFESSLIEKAKTHENAWEYWGLTKQEWDRYTSIKEKSPWSVWKNEATPLAILSHYSSSPAEKIRYARIAAELDQWRENTVLEWQAIYNHEREIVYEKNRAVAEAKKPDVKNITASDRVLYFVEAGPCEARCRALTNRLLTTSAHIDIFVRKAKTEKEVFAWATAANIPVDRVHVKQITLNMENNYMDMVTTTPISLIEFPIAYLQTKSEYKAVIF
ncbi:integrating conjugative element protein [Cellvibrio zantedeschiae]|uniref:Integrating conjugative element protein n=1 Tax=Cellvibrio zantedeschiae TaxID=1237077 RepID=A0ABQ3B7J6_9GAMM|nr:hypothetical protein [Cellvibrio zantedeschiae]GGY79110.1 integrating conjugative element protein [Cellvibrio zantedeschiae]